MDVKQLQFFMAVMESSSVTRAAEQMGVSPAAISLQMQSLAAELQVELFVRQGRRIAPTAQAQRLAAHAKDLIRAFQEIREDFNNDPATDHRPFHFATGPTTLIHRLGRPLRMLRAKYPRVDLHVMLAATEEIVEGLLDRRFDLGLISLPFTHSQIETVPLYHEELLVVRPSKQAVGSGQVDFIGIEELANVPFLLYPGGSNMRAIIDRFFEEAGLQPKVVMEADDTEAIKALVETGCGNSILPEFAVSSGGHFFTTHRVKGFPMVREQALAMVKTDLARALTVSIAADLQTALKIAD